MAKGPLAERLAVASQRLPMACASELFLTLSKDEHPDVRRAVAENKSIPSDSVCRVYGRLHKDKERPIVDAIGKSMRFKLECDGDKEMDYTIEQWYGFDVKRADAHCKGGCNYNRLIGELEAQDVGVVSVHDWKHNNDELLTFKELGFKFIPAKVSWQMEVDSFKPDAFEEYLSKIKKGDYVRRYMKKFNEEGIIYVTRDVNETQDNDLALYKQWYAIYHEAMAGKKRGRFIIKPDEPPRHLTAIYALDKDNKVLGGILFNARRPDIISGGYGAFRRGPSGLSDVGMVKMVEYAIQNHHRYINLGMDTNFYGFHLGTGLYAFKTSLGYTPHALGGNKGKHEYFRVIDDSKFDNPYMFLSYQYDFEDYQEKYDHTVFAGGEMRLENNVFVKDDSKVYVKQFNAPEGIVMHYKGQEFERHAYQMAIDEVEFFQSGGFALDYGGH